MYNATQRATLLRLAYDAIQYGLENDHAPDVNPDDYEESLNEIRACFVTLHFNGKLRGCIGSLEARRPLIKDVAHNAFGAAFQDPRFTPLIAQELSKITIELSILTPPVEMSFISEADLLKQIRPGIDGLIIKDTGKRGTFLPSVWEQLPEKAEFLRHLKLKAGLSPRHWSDTLQMSRYETESFG